MPPQLDAQPLLDWQATLGEGPLWDPERAVLWWVDIEAGHVHRYDPASAENKTFEIGQRVGTVVVRESGGLMLALQNGLASYDPDTGKLEIHGDPEADMPDNRFNDGKCDPEGRFWAGTMNFVDPRNHHTGSLYSLDLQGNVTKHLSDIGVSNGIVWSSDARTMFYVDSMARRVDAFDYDRQSGKITNRRSVFDVPEEMGGPDGMAIDTDDKLWVAFYRGSCVAQIDPQNGQVLTRINLPVRQVTACAFGGPNMDDLYITTARENLDEAAIAEQPLAGNLFHVRPGARGVVFASYRG